MIWQLAWREFRLILASPSSWLLLAVAQAGVGWWFLLLVEQYRTRYEPLVIQVNSPMGVNDLVIMPYFGSVLLLGLLLLAAALMAMRLVAEERRSGSIQLLFAAPVRMTELVLAKYLAGLGFLILVALPWVLMPLALEPATVLDRGRLLSSGLGLLLLSALLVAVAVYASCLSRQPPIAALLTMAIGLLLMGINAGAVVVADHSDPVLGYVSVLTHYQPLVQGLVNSANLAYFLLFSAGFLFFAVRRLDSLRLQA